MRIFLAFLALLIVPATARADLLVTEIAANPALPEPAAEFVVVQNTGLAPVVLDGMRLTDSAGATRGAVPPGTSLDPGQRIALQPSAGAAAYACSPLPHRALLTAWAPLNNTGDAVVLEAADGRELDRVPYPAEWFAVDGPSRVFDRLRSTWSASVGDATPCAVAPPRPGRFRFAQREVSASEHARAATLQVVRSGGTNGRVSVAWRAVDASATRGSDHSADAGTVTFAAGQERAAFSVPLLDDNRDEADESFTVVLGGADLEEPTRAVVRVLDDDAPAPPVLVTPAPAAPLPPPASGSSPAPAPPGPAPSSPTPPVTPPVPAQPPRATLQVAAWQQILRRREIAAVVRCDRECDVRVAGRVALGGGRSARLATATLRLPAHTPTVVLLRLPQRYVKPLRRALRRHGSLRAAVSAHATGGVASERRVRVR